MNFFNLFGKNEVREAPQPTPQQTYEQSLEHQSYCDTVKKQSDFLKMLFEKYGTNIIIISDDEVNKTYEQELTDDLLSIIHYYSMKSYSHRRKLNNAAKALKADDNTED